jgi:cellulose synthase/poly-beta-1,6-N-acetylglucosamine synthase-like glycosyltransferase
MSAADHGIAVAFWIALLLPMYSYLLFPPLILLCGAIAARRHRRSLHSAMPARPLPELAIVVSAHNEEREIASLLSNLASLEYPNRPTIYIGSDGSTDRTAEILEACTDPRVRVFLFAHNRGKASVLNDLLAAGDEPVIVFMDANTRFEHDALLKLARHFTDPKVGAVCGELELRSASTGDNVDGRYWRLERRLKASESALGALLGANGGIYAIRRECFVPIRPDTIVDDFCIAMTVSVHGRSLIYDPLARASEQVPERIHDEFRRRVRIGIGNYQAFFRHPEYLLGAGVRRGLVYVSHKVLRWFTPHLLLLALALNLLLLQQPLYRLLLVLQLAAYALGALLLAAARWMMIPRLLRIPAFLMGVNVAFCVGFCLYLTGRYSGSWKRTARA